MKSLIIYLALILSVCLTTHLDLDDINLNQEWVKVNGASIPSFLGKAVSNIGDFNGDGFDDLLINAPENAFAETAYVIYGQKKGFSHDTISLGSTFSEGFTIHGPFNSPEAGARFGFAVSKAIDLNGDGLYDIVFGAHGYNNYQGMVYVIYGKKGHTGDITINADYSFPSSVDGFVIFGPYELSNFGRTISSAGDFNGDGFTDLLIGASKYFGGQGSAYIIYGKSSKYTANIDLETTQAGFSFVCPTGDTCSLGSAVDGVGDINGDGVDDILIGDDSYYRVYGFYGKKNRVDTSLTVDSSLDSTQGFIISTTSYAEYFGEILSSAGDFNNDGIKDIIIGTTSKGAFVYYGRKENWESFDIDTNPETLRIKDSLSGIRPAFGIAVYGGGDVNGDGVDDILIRGEYVAVLYGSKTRKTGTFDMATDLTAEEGLKISSSDFNWQTHSASIERCLTIGDMDNDKIDDIILGAPIAERFSGRAYIVFGTNGCPKHCSTCEGTKCLTCSTGYGLYESTCGDCPAGTSLTDTGICQIGGMSSCSSDGKDTQNAVFKGLFDGTSAVSNAIVLGSSMATNFGLVSKMMRNSQYLDIAMSDNLQETFCTWKVSTGIFPAPKSDDVSSGSLPWVFGRYGMKKAFLVNYWKTFTIILLGLAVGIAGFIITKITLKEDSKIPKILVMMTSNFVLAQFYVSVDDIFLFFVLDARSRESASSSFRTFAFILGILLLLVGFVITGLHGAMMSKLQYSFKKSKKLKLLFADYKETRNFLFINVVRSLISSFIFAMLFEHPLAQIPLLMVLNLCVLVFLFVGKPFKDQINAYAQYCCEGLLFVSYLAILVLASMKKSGKGSEKSIKGWGMVLVVCNAMLLLGTVIFMLFKIFRALKTYKEEHDKSLHSKIEVVPVSLDSTQKLGESPLIRPISLNLSQTASTTFLPETGSSPTLGPKRRTLKVKSHKMTESPPFRPEESQSHTISGNFMLNSHLASERIQEESPMNEEETHRQENSPAGGRREDIHSRLNRMKLQRLRGSNL